MGSYSTLYINIVFKKETPQYITDYFHKGIMDDRVPKPIVNFCAENKINLSVPNTMICTYDAKTYIAGQPQNHYQLLILREYELDQFYLTYGIIATLAQYAQDNSLAGYIKSEFDNHIDLFAYKNGETLWLMNQNINTKPEEKLSVFELEAIGHKIKYKEGTVEELQILMTTFDKNVPYPNGSSLFYNTENKNADLAMYNLTVEEIVSTCLDYKA